MKVKEFVRFTVAPYALYDVIQAISNENMNNLGDVYQTYVTKEDNDLVVVVRKQRIVPSEECCAAPTKEMEVTSDVD